MSDQQKAAGLGAGKAASKTDFSQLSTLQGIDSLLSRLERVKQTGAGRWQARCPAHDDKGPSLSVREADDGKVLIYCFAGCLVHIVGQHDILAFKAERSTGAISGAGRSPVK